MSTNTVSVLTPHGRRQTVKCMPNKTIMQIIEEVCKKHGFNPEDYDIKHHNKIVDTTLAFRFSGLPNNAQLELVEVSKSRTDTEVTLAINLENGTRLIGQFMPDETLWNILLKLCPNNVQNDQNVVVVYMRNEIFGGSLRTTTLKALGLRGGRALLHLLIRDPSELKAQANVSAPLPSKPAVEKPYHRTLKTDAADLELGNTLDKDNKIAQKNEHGVDLVKLAREKRKLEESNLKSNDAKPSKSKPKETNENRLKPNEKMDVHVARSTKSEPLPEKDDDEVLNSFVFLGERNAMLFSLDTANSLPAESLPDDFFELTIDDAKKILKDIRNKQHQMENANLMTAAMRNLEESKKQLRNLSKYKQAIVRIQFPDRSILQGVFKPTETINDVICFVNEYLQEKIDNLYVYVTPPKSILPNGHLIELGCVPNVLLHLGAYSNNKEIRLRADLRDKFTTNSLASLAASKMRKTTKNPTNFEEDLSMEVTESINSVNTPGPSSQATSYERKTVQSSEKVPKWFKPSK